MPDMPLEWQMQTDARHLGFTLARYKFVAKMFDGYHRVLEIGCGNRFGGQVVAQAVGKHVATDIDTLDITKNHMSGYAGVFMLDVFEHIPKEYQFDMLKNLRLCAPVCIIGTPSVESQKYASAESVRLHVNCVSSDYLKQIMLRHWKHVFIFGMNDETLHTGFGPMCHYIIAMGVNDA